MPHLPHRYTPQLVTRPLRQDPPNKLTEVLWGLLNCLPTAALAAIAWSAGAAGDGLGSTDALGGWLIGCICAFALVFAVRSRPHTWCTATPCTFPSAHC